MSTISLHHLHARFLSILPKIRTHARIYFRHVKCHCRKADFIAEAIALAWKWFVRLTKKGKDACQFPSTLATFAAKAVRNGRRITGQLKPNDVHSERAQQMRGFSVSKLPEFSTLNPNPLSDALIDNTQSPVPDQVQFRCDFPEWLLTHTRRDRTLAVEMAKGERTSALAHRFKISPARVSQVRRHLHDSWEQFTSN